MVERKDSWAQTQLNMSNIVKELAKRSIRVWIYQIIRPMIINFGTFLIILSGKRASAFFPQQRSFYWIPILDTFFQGNVECCQSKASVLMIARGFGFCSELCFSCPTEMASSIWTIEAWSATQTYTDWHNSTANRKVGCKDWPDQQLHRKTMYEPFCWLPLH